MCYLHFYEPTTLPHGQQKFAFHSRFRLCIYIVSFRSLWHLFVPPQSYRIDTMQHKKQHFHPTLQIYHRRINTLSFLMRRWLALKFIVDQIWIFIKGLLVRSLVCLLPVSFQTYFHVFRMPRMWASSETVLIMRGSEGRRTWPVNW